jgi:hypothetical protein
MLHWQRVSDRTELAVRPSHWTLRLVAPPEQVMTSLAAVSAGRVWVVERKGSTVVLSMGGREPAPRVIAEVREREGGSEVAVRLDGADNTTDGLLATVMALLSLILGLANVNDSRGAPLAVLLLVLGSLSLVSLIRWRISALRERQADFKAIAQAIDAALRELKPGEEGAVYRVGAGTEPVSEEQPADDGLGIFRSRARRSR